MSQASNQNRTALWPQILRLETAVFLLGLGYYAWFLLEPSRFIDTPLADDPMAWSGFGLLLAGVAIARVIQGRFSEVLASLTRSGAISERSRDAPSIERSFQSLAAYSTLCVLIPLLLIYHLSLGHVGSDTIGKPHLRIGGSMGIFLISVRFAHGVATGLISRRLASRNVRVFLVPDHPDRSAGLGRLGFFYFDQALIILIPALFMAFWMVFAALNMDRIEEAEATRAMVEHVGLTYREEPGLIATWTEQYEVCADGSFDLSDCPIGARRFLWQTHFFYLILFNLVIFSLAWVLPLLNLRRAMTRAKAMDFGPQIAALETRLRDRRREILAEDALNGVARAEDDIAQDAHRLARYRLCPTLPIPIWTALTAVISNLSAFVGLLSFAPS